MENGSTHLDPDELLGELVWLRRLARSLVGSAGVDEDLVQETWLAAQQTDGHVTRAWLVGTLRNLAAGWFRREARLRRRESAAARPERVDTESLIERNELLGVVLEGLRSLDEPYCTALLLLYQEGLPVREAARQLGIPEDTLRWQRREGLARLRQRMDREGGRDWRLALLPLVGRPGVEPAAGTLGSWKWVFAAGAIGVVAIVGLMALFGGGRPETSVPQSAALALGDVDTELPRPEQPENVRAVAPGRSPVASSSSGPSIEGEGLNVTVIDQERKRVVGARVWAGPSRDSDGPASLTGEDGVAVLASPTWELGFVMASQPGRFGQAQVLRDFSGGDVVVTLLADADMNVRAVDRAGAPVAGVPLVDLGPAPGFSSLYLAEAARTDESGFAVLRHVLLPFWSAPDADKLVVGAAGLFREPLTVAVSREELSREPVPVVLPPAGSLRVEVRTADGDLNTAATSVRLALDLEPGRARDVPVLAGLLFDRTRPILIAPLEGGRADLPLIGLGLDLVASAPGADPMDSTFGFGVGPTEEGESALLTLRPLVEASAIAGVALDTEGVPLANTVLRARVSTQRASLRPDFAEVLRTDERGRFRLVLNAEEVAAWNADFGIGLELGAEAREPLTLMRGWVSLPAELVRGENDAGAVVLDVEAPLLVGVAHDAGGDGASLNAVWLEGSAGEAELEPLTLLVEGEEFAVFAEPNVLAAAGTEDLSLVVDAEGFARQRFDRLAGQQRATIALDEAASLHGQLHSTTNEFLFLFEVAAFSRDAQGRRLGHGWVRAAQNGRFRLEGLPRGACELEVRSTQTHDVLAYRVGVRPGSSSSTQQASLDAIRIDRPLLHFYLQATAGGEVLKSTTFSPVEKGELGEEVSCLKDGWLSLWGPNESLTGWLRAPGYRPRQVTLLAGESFEELELDPDAR